MGSQIYVPGRLFTYFSTFPLLNFRLSRAIRLRHPSSPRVALEVPAVSLLRARVLEAGAPIAGISNRLGNQRRDVRLLDVNGMGEPRGDARVSQQRGAPEGDAQAAAVV